MGDAKPRGEFALIRRYFKPLATDAAALGLGDDAAIYSPRPGMRLAITADALTAGVHFLMTDPPAAIARKMLRVNLSDLAAMGARPLGYLMTLALPATITEEWIAGFCDGLKQDQQQFGLSLWGGDTTQTPGPLTLSLTAIGELPEGRALRRGAARVGDRLWVSGSLGDAALGLRVAKGELGGLAKDLRAALIERYRLPEPRLALGQALIEAGLSLAALDLSDGLLQDAGHIAEESKLRVVVERARLPLSAAARAALDLDPALWPEIYAGGDDYELLFTANPESEAALIALGRRLGHGLTSIGRIEVGEGVALIDAEGNALPITRAGWQHF